MALSLHPLIKELMRTEYKDDKWHLFIEHRPERCSFSFICLYKTTDNTQLMEQTYFDLFSLTSANQVERVYFETFRIMIERILQVEAQKKDMEELNDK